MASFDDALNAIAGSKAKAAPPPVDKPATPSLDDALSRIAGTKATPADAPPAPSSHDDALSRIAGSKAAPAPPMAAAPPAPDGGGAVATPETAAPSQPPPGRFSGGAAQAGLKKPATGGEVWQSFLAGMKDVPRAGAEAFQAEQTAEQKAGLPDALHYLTSPIEAIKAEAGQAMGTVFDSAVKAALSFAKDAGMSETTQNQLEGDLNTLLQVGGSIADVNALPGLHAKIKETLQKSAPPGTAEAFDKASMPADRGGPTITVHHGSPHQFEQFDTAKVGTGSSNQARGHGLYFAEDTGVAQHYADTAIPGQKGHLYTSTIHGTPDEFLHWDKPVSEQSPHVQEALKKSPEAEAAIKRLGGDPTGEQVYRAMAEDAGGGPETPMEKLPEADKAASQALNQAGIKGNKYADGGRAGVGKGTTNYVVFNHDDVSITHVNGEHLADIVAKARGGPPAGEPPFAGPAPGTPPGEPPPPTHADITATQTDLADRLHAHNQGVTADRIDTMELGAAAHEAIPDQAMREKMIHHQEQPDKVPLSPEEQGLFDKHVLPIIREREAVQAKIADLEGKPHYPAWPAVRTGEDIAHAPRFVKDKGSTIDWLLQGIGRRVGRQSLSKVGDKARTVAGPMLDNPKVAYYKDSVVNNLVKLEDAKRQLRNMQMLEHLKSDPGLDHLREPTHPSGWGQTPGWKAAGPPQLAGMHWHPRIANAIDDAFKDFRRSGDAATFYAHVNRVLVGLMFYSPIGHVLNVFADTLVSKGLVGTAVDLATGRSFKAFGKALGDVWNLTPEYRKNLRAGSSLQYGAVATENFVSDLVKGLDKHVKVDPKSWAEIARAGGYANPANLVAGLYRASRRGLWLAGDVLKLTRQYELEAKGMSRAEAIKETEKHIVSYRVPPEVAGRRWLSEVIQNPYILSFSRYHYGLLKSLATTARDLAKGTPAERMRAVDSALMMGVVYLGYRAADDQVRKLTGNKDASIKRSGIFGLADVVEKAATGDKDARDVVQRIASLNPVATTLATLYEGKDPYTGQTVVRGRDLWEHPGRFAKEIGTVFGGKLAPIKEGVDLATGKASPQAEILKQLNISAPDPNQAERARIARLKADRALQKSLRKRYGN